MITTGTTGTSSSASGAASMKQQVGMNQNDFLKLFVAQLQNQDPLSPADSTQFVTQLAQISAVEQAYDTNTNLQSLLAAQNNSAQISAVSFIGKTVVASGNQVTLAGNQPAINFTLDSAASQVTVAIKNSAGTTVRTLTASDLSAGDASVTWDGKDGNGAVLANGTYTFSVSGTDAGGNTISPTTIVKGKVDGVNFNGDQPMLTVGGMSIPFSSVLSMQAA